MKNIPFKQFIFFVRLNTFCLFILLLIVSYPDLSSGHEIGVKPELSVKETYDDNIMFTLTNEFEDFLTTVSPSLSFARDTEKLETELKAGSDILRYSSEDELDSVDDHYEMAIAYLSTDQLLINLKSDFARDSTIESDLQEAGLITLSDKEKIRIIPSFSLWVSELNGLRFSSYLQKVRYDNPFYLDYEFYSGFLEWGHVFSPRRIIFFVHSGYGLVDNKYGTADNYGLLTGFDLDIIENWSLSFRGGAHQLFLEADLDELPPEVISIIDQYNIDTEEDYLEPVGYITLKRSFEKGHFASAEFTKEIVPSGENAAVDRLKGTITFEYFFTENFRGNLEGAWISSESLNDEYLPMERETYSGNLWFQYQFRKATSLKLSYRYATFIDHERDDDDATRNLAFIEIIQDWNTAYRTYVPAQTGVFQIWKRFLKYFTIP